MINMKINKYNDHFEYEIDGQRDRTRKKERERERDEERVRDKERVREEE